MKGLIMQETTKAKVNTKFFTPESELYPALILDMPIVGSRSVLNQEQNGKL